jgi:hypothetical protein
MTVSKKTVTQLTANHANMKWIELNFDRVAQTYLSQATISPHNRITWTQHGRCYRPGIAAIPSNLGFMEQNRECVSSINSHVTLTPTVQTARSVACNSR